MVIRAWKAIQLLWLLYNGFPADTSMISTVYPQMKTNPLPQRLPLKVVHIVCEQKYSRNIIVTMNTEYKRQIVMYDSKHHY